LPTGYQIEAVAVGLTFPSGVTSDDQGRVYVVETGYSYGEVWAVPRLLRLESDGRITEIATGEKNGPWTGVTFYKGFFYVAEGGELQGGRILRIAHDGTKTVLIDNLPTRGDHHTNGPVIGPDGYLYFGQGTYTNSGVVGHDNAEFGWLKRFRNLHDILCKDIRLNGRNFTTANPIQSDSPEEVLTGAFSPFGKPTSKNEVIRGQVPCSGSVLKLPLGGGSVELVAWGFRNPFGLAFSPDGNLFVTDNSYDTRGSRPVYGTGDILWQVKTGAWYGWPDYHGTRPLDEAIIFDRHGRSGRSCCLPSIPRSTPADSYSRRPFVLHRIRFFAQRSIWLQGRSVCRSVRGSGEPNWQGTGTCRVQGGSHRSQDRFDQRICRQQGLNKRSCFVARPWRFGTASRRQIRSVGNSSVRGGFRRYDDDR
jgi:hypothetical protein